MSGTAGRTLAQSKLNLGLRILGREESGFHSIETVFHRLDLGDDVTVRVTGGGTSLTCDVMRTENAEKNLAFRAARAYSEAAGWPKGFEIDIGKRIPIGGGLGGGSADAAAVLRILDALAPKPLSAKRLSAVAASLGSDVPFLTSDALMALAYGRGEKIEPLDPLPSRRVRLFVPTYGISTAAAYGAIAASRGEYAGRKKAWTAQSFRTWEQAASNSVNDFEAVLRNEHSDMDALLRTGEASGLFLRLTGSGSSVFLVEGVTVAGAKTAGSAIPAAPEGTSILKTSTAESVVPVEIVG
ncbi:MAG TPA: 4-(cytidine 5'-diphospho)-2-C-methyl-D-erythritol kinase [Gemmatimonadaceae bacterium]|nr:4-(cytidine 5'-diphospho)-2-C-methyl-D-erythritol kinase [Gemmatimonadaceae bacterium]